MKNKSNNIEPNCSNLQQRMREWLLECFGEEIAGDKLERNHRFLEESLELVQACGCAREEAHTLVNYVFNRPVGEKKQEVGGVMTTLNALCSTHGMDVMECAEAELERVWTMIPEIRAKQAAKPKNSPLPETPVDKKIIYEPIRLDHNTVMTVSMYTRTNEFVEMYLKDDGDYLEEDRMAKDNAPKQFIHQLKGRASMRFMMGLRDELTSVINAWADATGRNL